jgi:hypothetical protein
MNFLPKKPQDFPLNADHRRAKANVLALLRGDDPLLGVAQDLKTLAARNRELTQGSPEAIKIALGDHLVILEEAMLRFMRDAASRGLPDHRRALASVALRCQSAFVQTCLALNKMENDHADSHALMGVTVASTG